jgi:hypothetical protein
MSKEITRRKFIADTSLAGAGIWVAPALFTDRDSGKLKVRVKEVGGVKKIEINDKIYDPLSFRSFRAEERNIKDFHKAGVRLMSIMHTGMNCTLDVPYSLYGECWDGIRNYNYKNIDTQMDLFIKNAPDTYFNVMLQLDTRDWYLKMHPEFTNSYWNLVEMAGVEQWRKDTAAFLQDMLKYFEEKYGDRIFSYTLFCGSSTEWYTNSQGRGRPEAEIREHPIKLSVYRKYTQDQNANLVPLKRLHETSNGVFRDQVADADSLRYWRFHHGIIGDTILYFAGKCQEILQHKKLLGLYYGYLTQLNGKRLLEEGHLAYERVWKCPDLDIIYAPAKYGQPRSFEGVSGFLLTVDSLKLQNKMMWQEIDHTTFIAPKTVENGRSIPGSDSKLKDEFQTRMVLRREFVLTTVKRTAHWWFDFFGGYYYHEKLMAEVANMVRVQKKLTNIHMDSAAEIAVFGDVESMYYTQAFSPLAQDLLVNAPDALARIGAPYDIYNFSDLDNSRINWSRYKLVIFMNTFLIPDKLRAFINKNVKTKGRTVLWMYAPDYIRNKGFSESSISEITGIKIQKHEGENQQATLVAGAFNLSKAANLSFGFNGKISPLFEVSDTGAATLAVFANSAPAMASKKFNDHTSVYCAVGNIPIPVYREIARKAGVHIYYEGDDPVYINDRLIGIHMQHDETHPLKLKKNSSGQLEELFDGGTIALQNGKCNLPHSNGQTKLYLINS